MGKKHSEKKRQNHHHSGSSQNITPGTATGSSRSILSQKKLQGKGPVTGQKDGPVYENSNWESDGMHYVVQGTSRSFYHLARMLFFSIIVGIVAGGVGILFYHCMSFATNMRGTYSWLLYFLPFSGLLIIFLYKVTGQTNNKGTNLILLAIHENQHVSAFVAPLMFVSTVITHLFGGSAGREGAALQIGGSLGALVGKLFRFDDESNNIFIMCGMSACFSAVFGTPLAAAIFALEVETIGLMRYTALVPCVIASFTASTLANQLKALPEHYYFEEIPDFSYFPAVKIIIIAVLFAAVSVLFCIVLHSAERFYKRYIPNPYARVFAGGLIVIAMVFIFGTRDYLGAGMPVIEECFEGSVPAYAFILKILFTAATLGAGFKGGEIVPAFFTGATLGCFLGPLFGIPAPLCAACGMVGLFCGVTNCPITSLFMAFELFGTDALPYYVITISICYLMSGYYGLYSSQKILYSKYQALRINRNMH